MTRSCSATNVSRTSVLFTSREIPVVLGRSAARDFALARVRHATMKIKHWYLVIYCDCSLPIVRWFVGSRTTYSAHGRATKPLPRSSTFFWGLSWATRASLPNLGRISLPSSKSARANSGSIKADRCKIGVIIPGILDYANRVPQISSRGFRAHNEPNLTRRICGNSRIGVLRNRE